ncbi:MAG: hypothetical protein ACOCVC_04995 [Spirochaeta sp.]
MAHPLLLILLLPLELLRPLQGAQEIHLYQDMLPAARIEILAEQDDAATADPGIFRLKIHSLDDQPLPESLQSGQELLVERSRRRGSVYSVHSMNEPPVLIDMTAEARRIPHDFTSRIGRPGESINLQIGESGQDIYIDFFTGMTLIRFPAEGIMLLLPAEDFNMKHPDGNN